MMDFIQYNSTVRKQIVHRVESSAWDEIFAPTLTFLVAIKRRSIWVLYLNRKLSTWYFVIQYNDGLSQLYGMEFPTQFHLIERITN